MTMKYKSSTNSSSSSSSSSSTSDGNAMDVNHPNYKKSFISKIRKAKSSSELEPNSSTDEDGSPGSICNRNSRFQKEKQTMVRTDAEVLAAAKNSAPVKSEWPPAESLEKKAWVINSKQAQSQAQHHEGMKQEEEGGKNLMDKEVPKLYVRQEPNITLVKSNSVSATKADNILKLDYICNPHQAQYNHKLQGHRLSTGDSPLHMQKRYGSQGPASHRITGFPSPGTPSRSSFSGVPTSMMLNSKAYYNMVGRIAVNDANGKLLPLYSLLSSSSCDQDINPGRLSVGFSSRAAPPPSKWDDAEKWLINASPSHPSQPPPLHPSKQAANYTLNEPPNTNPHVADGKKNTSISKRVLNDVVVPPSPVPSLSQMVDHHHYINKQLSSRHTSKEPIQDSGLNAHAKSMHESYIQSRSLVPLASSSSDGGQMHEDGAGSACMSDSELSNAAQEVECQSTFVRSSSHRQSDGKHKGHMRKGQLGRKATGDVVVRKEELVISSPVSVQLERLKLGSSTSSLNDQLPRMHDVYAVETRQPEGPCADEAPRGENHAPASSSMTRLVVQAGKVVGTWGAGAMRDASTDVSPKMSMSRRDMGTQMTPVASCKTSRAATPRKQGGWSPMCQNFDATLGATSAEGCQMAKLDKDHVSSSSSVSTTTTTNSSSSWKSLQESLLASADHAKPKFDPQQPQPATAAHENSQYSAWEEAERSKHKTKCAREEARIDAWESHQKAKAEAELRKLEMKLERLRAQVTEKIMNKVATAHLRAEEMRATARAQQAQQLAKALERANSLNKKGYLSESLGVCFSIMP
ncbi:hypothetical protein L7F22_011296 [Adiantum nelumboides]|nr:hypothetical protein [Adiantum nelumboides]